MSDETPKQTADFSDEVDVKIPEYIAPAKKNKSALPDVLDNLLSLEKKTRLACDIPSTKKTALAILEIISECKEWKVLNDHILLLCRRRAQLKGVVQAVVQEGFKYVEAAQNEQIKLDLIDALREVSEGKIYVELERARLTKILSDMREKEGKVSEAAELLQEVQVEIMGTMEKKEKAEFLLEQIRLTIAKGDYIRVELLSKKVNKKILHEDPEFQDLKLKFYRLMIRFYNHSHNYIEICKAYRAIFDTPIIQENKEEWQKVLRNIVVHMLLSAHDDEQAKIVEEVRAEKKLLDLEEEKAAVDLVCTPEIIGRPIPQEKNWKDEFFTGEDGAKRLDSLNKRIIQHNIRIIAKYYTRIRFSRLATLLQLDADKTELYLSEMVSDKALVAKMDRPAGIVTFQQARDANVVLNEWSSDISELLNLVELACHRIDKENMMAKSRA